MSHLFVSRERQRVADVVADELAPDGGQGREVLVGVVVGPHDLAGDAEGVGQSVPGDGAGDAGQPHAVLVLRGHDPEVGGAGHAPHRVLDVVALPVGRTVLLGEAERGLHVRADFGEHRVLDGHALHAGAQLGAAQGEAGT